MSFYNTQILVTGGSGLVGSHLLPILVAKGYPVRATYRSSHPEIAGVEWVEADILDVIALEEAMRNQNIVIHCAGLVSYDPSQKQELRQLNVTGTANIVNEALDSGIRQLIYVSSVASLGEQEDSPITEELLWKEEESHSDYAKSKHDGEIEIRRGEIEGLNITIVNPAIILGNGDWEKGSTALFRNIYHEFPYYTNGIHGFVDVMDVATVLIYLIDKEDSYGQRFILNGFNISYKQLFEKIAKSFGKSVPNKFVSATKAEIVWRLSYLKSKLAGTVPVLTKHSAHIAQANIQYDNSKILGAIPNFHFRSADESIVRICQELKLKYSLS